MSERPSAKKNRVFRAAVVVVAVVFACALLGAVLWARAYMASERPAERLRVELTKYLAKDLETDVAIEELHFDLSGRASARGIRIGPPETALVSHGAASISLDWPRLLRSREHYEKSIRGVVIENADITLIRDKNGKWNYPHPKPKPPRKGPIYPHLRIPIKKATLRYRDAGEKPSLIVRDAYVDDLAGTLTLGHSGSIALEAASRKNSICGNLRVKLHLNGKYGWSLDGTCAGVREAVSKPVLRMWGVRVRGPEPRLAFRITSRFHGPGKPHEYHYSLKSSLNGNTVAFEKQDAVLEDVRGSFTFAEGVLDFEGIKGVFGGGPVTLNGTLTTGKKPVISLNAGADGVRLSQVGTWLRSLAKQHVEGLYSGRLYVYGPLAAPEITTDALVLDAVYGDYRADRVEALVSLRGGTLDVARALVKIDGAELEGRGRIRFGKDGEPGAYALITEIRKLDARTAAAYISAGPIPDISGTLSGELALAAANDKIAPEIIGTLTSDDFRAGKFEAASASISFSYNAAGLNVDSFIWTGAQARVYARGLLEPGGAMHFDIEGVEADTSFVMGLLGRGDMAATGTVRMEGALTGTTAAPVFDGIVSAAHVGLGAMHFDHIRGGLRYAAGTIALDKLDLWTGAEAHEINGTAAADGSALNLTLKVSGADVRRMASLLHDIAGTPDINVPDLSGSISAAVSMTGSVRQPDINASVDIRDLALYGEFIDSASFNVAYNPKNMTLSDGQIAMRDSSARFSGTVASDTLNIQFQSDSLRLEDLNFTSEYRAIGALTVRGSVAGPTSSPTVLAVVSFPHIRVRGLKLTGSPFTAIYRDQTLSIDHISLARGRESFAASGLVTFGEKEADYTFTIDFENATPDTYETYMGRKLPVETTGVFNGRAQFISRQGVQTGSLAVDGAGIAIGTYPLDTVRLAGAFDGTRLLVDEFEAGNATATFRGSGVVDLVEPRRSLVNLDATRVDLAALADLNLMPRGVSGLADINLATISDSDVPYTLGSFYVYDLDIAGVRFDRTRGVFEFDGDRVILSQLQLDKDAQRLTFRGEIPLPDENATPEERRFQLLCTTRNFDLATLNPIFEKSGYAFDGQAEFINVAVQGDIQNPELHGEIVLTDVTLRYRDLKQPVEHITGRLTAKDNSVIVSDVYGFMNGVRIGMRGRVDFKGLKPDYYELAFDDATDVPVVFRGDMYDGLIDIHNLKITGSIDSMLLTSPADSVPTVTLHNGTLTLRGLSESSATGTQFMTLIDHELSVYAGRDFIVRTPGDTMNFTADGVLRIAGNMASPQVKGRLTTTRGFIRLTTLNMVFKITDEAIIGLYTLPRIGVVPFFSAHAQARKSGLKLDLAISGPLINLDEMPDYQRLCGITDVNTPEERRDSPFLSSLAGRTVPLGETTDTAVSLCPKMRLTATDSDGQTLSTNAVFRRLTHTESIEEGRPVGSIIEQELLNYSTFWTGNKIAEFGKIDNFDLTLDPNKDFFIQLEKCVTEKICFRYEQLFSRQEQRKLEIYYKFRQKSFLLWGIDQDSQSTYEVEYRFTF